MLKSLVFWATVGSLPLTACLLTDPLDDVRTEKLSDVPPDTVPDPTNTSDETPCQMCLDDSCSSELNVCADNLECVGLLSCLSDCDLNDAACQQNCTDPFGGGVDNLLDVLDCTEAHCTSDCG